MWAEDKVRISDIAQELGLSTATVSNVLHGKTGKISAATAARVQRCLEERGYIPNMAATLLGQNPGGIVGFAVHDHPKYEGHPLEDPFLAGAVGAMVREADAAGKLLMVRVVPDLDALVQFASMWNMESLIVIGFCRDDYPGLRSRIRVPLVVFDGYCSVCEGIGIISLRDREGGILAGRHLAALGHTSAVCITDNLEEMDRARIEGFAEGFGNCTETLQVPWNRTERIRFYDEHSKWFTSFTAAFAVSDVYAMELAQYLNARGISVPESFSVVGFDGTWTGKCMQPSLTSISQDCAHRARTALQLAMEMRQDRALARTILLPVKLQTGGSSGICLRLRH